MPLKAVMYGAGNIGRGFIGQIFAQSGYELCFIDVAEPVIHALNRDGRYPVRILRDTSSEDIWIEGVRAINGNDMAAAAQAIAEADIMATAVGVRVLPLVAPVMAEGLKRRFTLNRKPLNIIICENLIDANKALERLIHDHLDGKERQWFNEHVGLVKASIGRMVPLQTPAMQDGNLLRVCVEAYGFLPVDKAAFKGDIPRLAGMHPFDHFDFYIQRKLFIHNMGHAICGYYGMIRGDAYIYETVGHGGIRYISQNAMLESALALSAQHTMPLADMYYHIQDLLRRFSNKALADTCARVGADTVRKLGSQDRFIGALRLCAGKGIASPFIAAGTAAALYCHLHEHNITQSREASQAALVEIAELADDSVEAAMVLEFHSILASSAHGNFDSVIMEIIKEASMAHTDTII